MRDENIMRLVEKLGGPEAIEKWIGCSGVKQWQYDGNVPWRWRFSVTEMADLKGLKLTRAEIKLLALIPHQD